MTIRSRAVDHPILFSEFFRRRYGRGRIVNWTTNGRAQTGPRRCAGADVSGAWHAAKRRGDQADGQRRAA